MDATLKLAFSVHSNPGVYALLLGSGISRPADIPTGWDIAQDIKEQIKSVGGQEIPEDTGYDELLQMLGKTKAERSAILRGYFEPTDEEREQGIKVPTSAHQAIAQLIKDGYIRVVLTTNFDRLIEIALDEIGITPDVIRSDDMLNGAPPIRHSTKVTIIQLHGDYQDTRTLNTAKELERYSDAKTSLLETVFDEYGLIVCGWSATWDTALRNALLRAKPRWYSTFWAEPHDLSDAAQDLTRHRDAEVIKEDANTFFTTLQGQVEALAKLNREHPLSVAVAVERVKKLIPYSHMQIELEDLIRGETDRALEKLAAIDIGNITLSTHKEYVEFYKERFAEALALTEPVIHMMATLCWYGDGVQSGLITEVLNRWGQPKDIYEEANKWKKMPALALMYVCGLASLKRDKWGFLKAAIIDPKVFSTHSQRASLLFEFANKYEAFDYRHYNRHLDDYEPASKVIREGLRPVFERYISVDLEYVRWFDLYEHVLALIMLEDRGEWTSHDVALRNYAHYNWWDVIYQFYRNGGKQGGNWGFLKVFFDGDVGLFQTTLQRYRESARENAVWRPGPAIPDLFAVYEGKPLE